MPRQALSHRQKNAIRDEVSRRKSEGLSVTQQDIGKWAKEKFRLPSAPSQPVLSRILSTKHRIKLSGGDIKRQRKGALPHLEKTLANWVRSRYDARQCITGDVIRKKAALILEEVNLLLGENDKCEAQFSSGWLVRFMKRFNLKSRRIHGESGDADNNAVKNFLPKLREKIAAYRPADVWNADETGLYYCMAPERTISEDVMEGRKKAKVRMTLLVCANATGTQKMPLMFIGQARRPRAFGRKTGQEHGFDYAFNKKAWMNTGLFFQWLQRFNEYIGRTTGRRALLLIDNCSAHGTVDSIPSLTNVTVDFLPPNTTSKLQPMDAGIIATFKTRYRKLQYERALDISQGNVDNIYKIDQLTAMKYCRAVWERMGDEVISNCWKATGLLDSGCAQWAPAPVNEQEVRELTEVVEQLTAPPSRMAISSLVNIDGGDCSEPLTLEAMAQSITHGLQEEFGDPDDNAESDCGTLEPLPSAKCQLESIGTVLSIIEGLESPNIAVLCYLRRLRRDISTTIASGRRQTVIESFFNK